jgi:hypothetical protein
MPLKRQSTANGKCQAKTKAGGPCAASAIRGGNYCALHANPERASQLQTLARCSSHMTPGRCAVMP